MDFKLLLLKEVNNRICIDCADLMNEVEYISINNGVFLCKSCALNHKKLDRKISFVRSVNDKWDEYLLLFIIKGGNKRFNSLLDKYNINNTANDLNKYRTKAAEYYRKLLRSEVLGDEPPSELPLVIGNEIDEQYESNLMYYCSENEMNDITDIYEVNKEIYKPNEEMKLKVKNEIIKAVTLSKDLLIVYSYNVYKLSLSNLLSLFTRVKGYLYSNKTQTKEVENCFLEDFECEGDFEVVIKDKASIGLNSTNSLNSLIIVDYINKKKEVGESIYETIVIDNFDFNQIQSSNLTLPTENQVITTSSLPCYEELS